jgi:hypothetical protein
MTFADESGPWGGSRQLLSQADLGPLILRVTYHWGHCFFGSMTAAGSDCL